MTVKYEYKCNKCGKDYIEQRREEEPQFFKDCSSGDEGIYELVKETKISNEV